MSANTLKRSSAVARNVVFLHSKSNAMVDFILNLFKLIAPYLFMLILIFSIAYLFYLLFTVIRKHFKSKSRQELEHDLQEMKNQNELLERQIGLLKQDIDKKNEQIRQKDTKNNSTLINIGTLQVRIANILYVVSQSFEQLEGGNSRVKVIHYVNSDKCDSVYTTFESLTEQLPATFMMINKNQLVNLNKISKIQGLSIYLEGVKDPFFISETKKDEFNKRMERR